MKDMRKVLIISYVWPPMEGVGLIRALKFARYLPLYGWKPVVLTVHPGPANAAVDDGLSGAGDVKVYRTGYRDIFEAAKKFLRFRPKGRSLRPDADRPMRNGDSKAPARRALREILSIPDDQAGWYGFAVKEGRKILGEERIDLIFSTSPPETSHLIAKNLKRYSGLPWVADLRDLWADDHYRARSPLKRSILRFIERRTLKDADRLITVSAPLARTLSASVYSRAGAVNVVENGFDEDDFQTLEYAPNDKLVISYTGKLSKDHQPLDMFCEVLSALIRDGRIDRDRIQVDFYMPGYDRPDLASIAGRYGLEGVIREFGKVGYSKSLRIQRASDLLLLVQWQGEGMDGWYSAKIFDYIGARRPVLALADRGGIIEDLIKRTSSGMVAPDRDSLRQAICGFYDEYVKSGSVKYGGIETEILKETRKERTGRLAEIFDSLAGI